MSLAPDPRRAGASSAVGGGPIRVLLVEDSAQDADLAARQLSQCAEPRFATTRVPTLSAALPIAQRGEHDAVLLELSFPDSTGLAGLHELALALPRTPIVVLTGAEGRSIAVQAIRHGAQDYLVKGDTHAGHLARSIQMAIERKSSEARLAERAYFDPLTGLVNRTLFRDRLAHALARARRTRGRAALLYIDLDGFKAINDALGHAAGDQVLRLVAERFRNAVRESETIARLGGDEFTVLIEPLRDATSAERAAERILAAFRAPFSIAGEAVPVTLSIGLALFPDHADDGDALLRRADAVMFRAKRAGRNNLQLFDDTR